MQDFCCMRIGVVTFYDAFNYGAYWQAKALEEFLVEFGGTKIYFLKTGQRRFLREYLKKIDSLRRSKQLSVKAIWFYFRMYVVFMNLRNDFTLIQINKAKIIDLFIFGSDEIWNIKRKINRRASAGILWGKFLPVDIPKISYAPSIADAKREMFINRADLLHVAKTYKAHSGRDVSTCETLAEVLGRELQLVVDPTLLHTDEYYKRQQILPDKEDYILIYSYGLSFTKQDVMQIKDLSKRTGKKLIAFGSYLEYADESIYGTVNEFLGYFNNAALIITDTFHGTMFAMIYKKPVALIVHKQGKVADTIKQYGLERFNCTGRLNEECLKLDYQSIWKEIYRTVDMYQEKSKQYIISQLEQIRA